MNLSYNITHKKIYINNLNIGFNEKVKNIHFKF